MRFFTLFLTEVSWQGSKVKAVRRDNSEEFIGEELWWVCLNNMIRHECTTAEMPKQNGMAQRRMALYSEVAQVAFIKAFRLLPTAPFSPKEKPEKLWAELRFWPKGTLNRRQTPITNRRSRCCKGSHRHCSFCCFYLRDFSRSWFAATRRRKKGRYASTWLAEATTLVIYTSYCCWSGALYYSPPLPSSTRALHQRQEFMTRR